MNPFDLRGPDFLLFYLVVASLTCLALYLWRRSYESGPLPTLEMNDPYLFAYLQGGDKQVARAGAIALIDRNLLIINSDHLSVAPEATIRRNNSEVESEILRFFATGDTFQHLL